MCVYVAHYPISRFIQSHRHRSSILVFFQSFKWSDSSEPVHVGVLFLKAVQTVAHSSHRSLHCTFSDAFPPTMFITCSYSSYCSPPVSSDQSAQSTLISLIYMENPWAQWNPLRLAVSKIQYSTSASLWHQNLIKVKVKVKVAYFLLMWTINLLTCIYMILHFASCCCHLFWPIG